MKWSRDKSILRMCGTSIHWQCQDIMNQKSASDLLSRSIVLQSILKQATGEETNIIWIRILASGIECEPFFPLSWTDWAAGHHLHTDMECWKDVNDINTPVIYYHLGFPSSSLWKKSFPESVFKMLFFRKPVSVFQTIRNELVPSIQHENIY